MSRSLTALILTLLVLIAACDDGTDTADRATTPPATPATAATTADVAPSPGPTQPTQPTEPTATATAAPPATEQPSPAEPDVLVRCDAEEGFSLAHPASWHTSSADGSPGCTQLHPEPFDAPGATDRRAAAITAFIDPVPFDEVVAPRPDRDAQRAVTTIDGLQAVRLEYATSEDLLYPAGTAITMYAIDLSPGNDDEPSTLFLDTIDLADFDYDRNQQVLDRIARTLEITRDDVPTAPDVVARYEGGGGGFTVHGTLTDGQACLRVPPEGEEACADAPGQQEVRTVPLVDLQPVLAGVTGEEVHRVTAERADGTTSTYLPAPIADTGVRGFAYPFSSTDVTALIAYDIDGNELTRMEGDQLTAAAGSS